MLMVFKSERTYDALKSVLESLPERDFNALHRGVALVTDNWDDAVIHGRAALAKSQRNQTAVIYLDSEYLGRYSFAYAAANIAHRLSGAFLGHHRASAKAKAWEDKALAASRQAVAWGFASLVNFDSLQRRPVGGLPKTFGEVQF